MDKILFVLLTYPLGGITLAVFHWIERFVGTLEVVGWENFPKQPVRILVASNHPSKTLQPLRTIGLFSPAYLLHPFKYGPYSVADKRNFYDRTIFKPVRCRIIPVNRANPADDECLRIARKVAKESGNQVWFPEGRRTWKGTDPIISKKGKALLPLKGGFARIVSEFDYTIIPVWYERISWRKTVIKIGKPIMNLGGQTRSVIVDVTTQTLLDLADQV